MLRPHIPPSDLPFHKLGYRPTCPLCPTPRAWSVTAQRHARPNWSMCSELRVAEKEIAFNRQSFGSQATHTVAINNERHPPPFYPEMKQERAWPEFNARTLALVKLARTLCEPKARKNGHSPRRNLATVEPMGKVFTDFSSSFSVNFTVSAWHYLV